MLAIPDNYLPPIAGIINQIATGNFNYICKMLVIFIAESISCHFRTTITVVSH
jgi:hypothetical protein